MFLQGASDGLLTGALDQVIQLASADMAHDGGDVGGHRLGSKSRALWPSQFRGCERASVHRGKELRSGRGNARGGAIHQLFVIGGGQQEDGRVVLFHAVELGEQGPDHLIGQGVGGRTAALSGRGIQFIDEEDAGGLLAGALEGFANLLAGLAEVSGLQIGGIGGQKRQMALIGDGAGDLRLAGARRAVQEMPREGLKPCLRSSWTLRRDSTVT